MIRNQLETSRINVVRFFKHGPCQTLVGLTRASTSSLPSCNKNVDGRDKPGHDDALMIEPRGRGVLDPRLRGDDNGKVGASH